jgi:hypothetical protein
VRPLLAAPHAITSSAREQRRRHGEAECFRGLEVDHQLELGWLLNGKIGLVPFRILST